MNTMEYIKLYSAVSYALTYLRVNNIVDNDTCDYIERKVMEANPNEKSND